MWVSDLLINLPGPILELQHALLPFEVLRAKECAPTFFPSVVFFFRLAAKSIKELGGVSHAFFWLRYYVQNWMQKHVYLMHVIVSGSLQVISDLFVVDYQKTNWYGKIE